MATKITQEQKNFLAAAANLFSDQSGDLPSFLTMQQILQLISIGHKRPNWLMTAKNSLGGDNFLISDHLWQAADLQTPETTKSVKVGEDIIRPGVPTEHIPIKEPLYVPEGSYFDLVRVFKSKRWLPIWITGPTGTAKTLSVEQACFAAGREYFRIQINSESDEASLLGTFQLRNGETDFVQSLIITAMERGGVLLLDECDFLSVKGLCLQPVLEGKQIYLSRAGRYVNPAPGFQCVATGNTKGRGDDTGMYNGANLINEAFLDRIAPLMIEHGYPLATNEVIILKRVMQSVGIMDEQFVYQLVAWANKCRENFKNGVISHSISPRLLCRIVEAYAVFDDRNKVMEMALSRFETLDKQAIKSYFDFFEGCAAPTSPVSNVW